MLSLFLVPSLPSGAALTVEGDEAHHAIKVMRLGMGEEILLSDGSGAWARAKITGMDKRSFDVDISARGIEIDGSPELVVAQALTKSDRTKESIELLVEGGVNRILPWQAQRSIAKWKEDSGEKYLQAAQTAAKQSRRFTVPQIDFPISTSELAKLSGSGTLILVFHESAEAKLSAALAQSDLARIRSIICVVGPEGGISEDELATLSEAGAKIVTLGRPVLRSAHAGIAALIAVQTLIGRF